MTIDRYAQRSRALPFDRERARVRAAWRRRLLVRTLILASVLALYALIYWAGGWR